MGEHITSEVSSASTGQVASKKAEVLPETERPDGGPSTWELSAGDDSETGQFVYVSATEGLNNLRFAKLTAKARDKEVRTGYTYPTGQILVFPRTVRWTHEKTYLPPYWFVTKTYKLLPVNVIPGVVYNSVNKQCAGMALLWE